MSKIYTDEWYESVKDAINKSASTLKEVPKGKWILVIEIVGDGVSPYVDEGSERHFLVSIEDGKCMWYEEIELGKSLDVKLNYRFRGNAEVFDSIAAGTLDPIDAALGGDIKVKGDMRFLLRQADQVQTLLLAYTKNVETEWPLGKPPYVRKADS